MTALHRPHFLTRSHQRSAGPRSALPSWALWTALLAAAAVSCALLRTGAGGWALAAAVPAVMCGVAMTLVLLRRTLVAVTVNGPSMEPAYHDGDRVLVRRNPALVRGMVAVVEPQKANGGWAAPPLKSSARAAELSGRRWIIKRIAAVPGDPVPHEAVPALAAAGEDRVPPGRLVLLGDNADASLDSRHYGYFPTDRVLGTVLRPLAPTRSDEQRSTPLRLR